MTMKTALVVCALVALSALVQSAPQEPQRLPRPPLPHLPLPYPDTSRGCIYVNGHCSSGCEEGTHSYGTGCGFMMPEHTCDNPNPTLDTRGRICDYFRCECDQPKVKDTTTRKCVLLEDCPKKTEDGGNSLKETDRTSTVV